MHSKSPDDSILLLLGAGKLGDSEPLSRHLFLQSEAALISLKTDLARQRILLRIDNV